MVGVGRHSGNHSAAGGRLRRHTKTRQVGVNHDSGVIGGPTAAA